MHLSNDLEFQQLWKKKKLKITFTLSARVRKHYIKTSPFTIMLLNQM